MLRRTLLLFCVICTFSVNSATWEIVYPQLINSQTDELPYPVKILEIALKQTNVNYTLKPSERILTQDKALRQLAINRDLDITWSLTDRDKEAEFRTIRIPLYKGLSGWRIFLIRPDLVEAFEQVTTLADLQQFIAVQGFDWADTSILRAGQFEVFTGTQLSNLYRSLQEGEADFFPRSMIEIWSEFASWRQTQSLHIVGNLGIHYPTAVYFFLNNRNSTLHNLIQTGLERAIENGQFDKLFFETHQTYINQANLHERLIFKLDNPLLPENTPLDKASLWFRTEDK